jgi:hypothetical protein
MKQTVLIALAVFVLCCSVSRVAAHNHLITPVPRDPRTTYNGDNNCENNNANVPGGNTFQRGGTINAKWSFNNHRGGFVRFSIVPKGKETSRGVFGQGSNIVHFTCHTRTCGGANVGFDAGDQKPCTTSFKVPTHLKDGNYVLQWIVYSMFDSDQNPNKGLPNYTSCANIKISGGSGPSGSPSNCGFSWLGGDKEYTRTKGGSGNTCAYFIKNTVGPAQATVKIDKASIKVNGVPAEVQSCGKGSGNGKTATGGDSASTGKSTKNGSTGTKSNSNTTTKKKKQSSA